MEYFLLQIPLLFLQTFYEAFNASNNILLFPDNLVAEGEVITLKVIGTYLPQGTDLSTLILESIKQLMC
jgi:hypothetical protein